MPDDLEVLIAGLRVWTREHDAHVRAAVELLIWHGGGGFWLARADFRQACIEQTASRAVAVIDWADARAFVDKGARASTSEMAILDLAVALGENRFRLSIMGHAHSRAIAKAVAAAVGLDRIEGNWPHA